MTARWRTTPTSTHIRRKLTLAALAGIGAAGSVIGLGATSAWLISRAAEHPPVLYLMVAIVAVRAFGVSRGILRYGERLASHDAALHILTGIRTRMYRRLADLAPAGLSRHRIGDLTARLVGDVDTLADTWPRLLLPYTVATVAGAGAVTLVATLLPPAAGLLAATLLTVAVLAPWLATITARHSERAVAPARGDLTATTVETLHGAADLIANNAGTTAITRIAAADRRLARAERRAAAGLGVAAAVSALAAGSAVWGALALGIPAVRSGALGSVLLAVVVLTPFAVHEVYAGLAPAAAQLPRLRSAAHRLTRVAEQPDPVKEPTNPSPPPGHPYELRVENLAARWHPAGPDVLRDVTLAVPPGHKVAVIGRTGAGKSTLAAALLRFLEPRHGRITINGVDTRTLEGDTLRRIIGLCAQDAHVFDTTLAENVRLARPAATAADVRDALGRVRLLDWATAQPAGLDTFVGEHGARLSGGQRQRLALARALLADFPILVLDEPTEHLDEPTAAALTADLLAATRDRTVILITHRGLGVSTVDTVYELDGGTLTAVPTDKPAAGDRSLVPTYPTVPATQPR